MVSEPGAMGRNVWGEGYYKLVYMVSLTQRKLVGREEGNGSVLDLKQY